MQLEGEGHGSVGALEATLRRAFLAREGLFDQEHKAAFRLFNGFLEGASNLAIDLYAVTALLHNYAGPPEAGRESIQIAQGLLAALYPWIQTVVLKAHHASSPEERKGTVIFGRNLDRQVREYGLWYAIDLCMNRDASLYLDTRGLRWWALHNLKGRTVLNTFAYTGSLGIAALGGEATRVIQLDSNRRFLEFARASCRLNGFPMSSQDFQVGDFWSQVERLKRSGERFDCVFLDPPFFSSTRKGVVDLAKNSARLINKVRPLINDGGVLVAVNNAVFVSGQAYLEVLEGLCADGYLRIEELIPVPDDFTGYPTTRLGHPITDPQPFNHATKIAILRVRRKTEALG
jgi:23S rRNA (cytosine1962-C5)-methyltransferase